MFLSGYIFIYVSHKFIDFLVTVILAKRNVTAIQDIWYLKSIILPFFESVLTKIRRRLIRSVPMCFCHLKHLNFWDCRRIYRVDDCTMYTRIQAQLCDINQQTKHTLTGDYTPNIHRHVHYTYTIYTHDLHTTHIQHTNTTHKHQQTRTYTHTPT